MKKEIETFIVILNNYWGQQNWNYSLTCKAVCCPLNVTIVYVVNRSLVLGNNIKIFLFLDFEIFLEDLKNLLRPLETEMNFFPLL